MLACVFCFKRVLANSTLRLLEYIKKHHDGDARQRPNQRCEQPDRRDYAVEHTPAVPSQTPEQDEGKQARTDQRQQRSTLEAHGGSMDLREAGCKRHRRRRRLVSRLRATLR
jgi:hypothetical protein